MTENEFKTKFETLMGDEDFRSKLRGLKERDQIKQLFSSNGLELSEDILDSCMATINKIEETDEIDPELLDFVAGGWSFRSIAYGAAFGAGLGYLGGNVPGAIFGGVIGGVVGGVIG